MGGYQGTLSGGCGESVAPAYGGRRSTVVQRMRRQDTRGELAQPVTPGVLYTRLVTLRISRVYQNIIVTIPIQ